ncbi:MAG TPA: hypothetical protein VD996_11760, partial [Chitinophagaceae bacterium]|nr:hypothetical protein [Chitinophagaceae bacterium]
MPLKQTYLYGLVLFAGILFFQPSSAQTGWDKLKQLPITESSFRAACDLMQQIGKTNLTRSYEMLAEYTPLIKATGNRQWLHVLLMGWAKAKGSTGYFEEAQQLYHEVWRNTNSNERFYRESLVALALLYAEWGKMDSLNKYLDAGIKLCVEANDK